MPQSCLGFGTLHLFWAAKPETQTDKQIEFVDVRNLSKKTNNVDATLTTRHNELRMQLQKRTFPYQYNNDSKI